MESLKNKFLVAMPHLNDTFFSKSVIYVCEHSTKGAMGMMINRPLSSAKVARILEELGFSGGKGLHGIREVYFGGPVQPGMGFMLHSSDYNVQGTLSISSDIGLTANSTIMEDILTEKGPQDYRFLMGYSGWDAEQLEREIANGDWLIIPADRGFIFDRPDKTKWEDAVKQFGIEVHDLSGPGGLA